ncbi:YceD family protein [Salinisphaera sp. T31B1]|uniref:YceD family protein n=1 Tax=Salinisphaera sp. T31B1 TaxID=727963 RepID=UPI00333EC468
MSTPETLPHRVDYRRLASQRRDVNAGIELARLPRVAGETVAGSDTDRAVAVSLRFTEDSQRRVVVAGSIETTLTLMCQRCLTSFDRPMHLTVAGVVVGDDEAAANVPRADEPILADSDMLDLHALVSDELLLGLPSVARCDRAECVQQYRPRAPESDREDAKDNPFAVLSRLKHGD